MSVKHFPGVNTTVRFMFTTHAASGAAVAPSSAFEAADVRVYKDGSATQRNTEAGYTMTSPFDSVTGLHLIAIDLSDNTDAGFYAAGSEYVVVLSPDETVDSLAVVRVIGYFRIVLAEGVAGAPKVDTHAFGGTAATTSGGRPEVNTSHLAGTAYGSADLSATMKASVNTEADTALSDYGALKPTVAGRTLDVSAGGEGGVDWANVGSPTTTVGLSGTTVKTATDVETDTQDIQARLPAALGANGNIKADVRDFGGTAGTNSAGRPEVNTTHLAGTAYATAAAALVTSIWDALTSGMSTVGSIGKRIVDYLTGAVALDSTVAKASALATAQASLDDIPTNAELATALDALPTAAENAAALLDLSNGVETSITPRQALRLILAAECGKLSGASTTTITIRNTADAKDRIVATVDSSGNRTALTLDAT